MQEGKNTERSKNASSTNQSTEKALRIMEHLAANGHPMRLLDISEELGINPSTAGRFLNSLINAGYVTQDPDTLRYFMTYKLCRIANMINMDSDIQIQQITHPYLEQISEIFDESSCVSIERDMEMVYIDVCTGRGRALLSCQRVGNTAPMHCTGNGKLCLLEYTDRQLDQLIQERGLSRLTENTITTKESLVRRLDSIRKAGYACDEEECEIGMRCLAYPIRNYTRRIIGGISVTGPSSRLTPDLIKAKSKYLEEAAADISEKLGYATVHNG